MKTNDNPYVSTTNACKLCTPLGACLAFRGIEGAVPFLHGRQDRPPEIGIAHV